MWNFDISKAPKSHEAMRERVVKGETQNVKYVVDCYIIAALPGPGEKVGRTRWLPSEGRWEGMTKGQDPVAWQPWPKYPELEAVG